MPYRRTRFSGGVYYHIFNRGNRKSPIFFETRDYARFLKKLQAYKNQFEVGVVAFALLPNHFHLLVISEKDDGIPKLMKNLLSSHSHYISVKHELQGHLFQGPFKAKSVIDEASFLQVFRYICLQPIKEEILNPDFFKRSDERSLRNDWNLIRRLREFPYGSYRDYLSSVESALLRREPVISLFGGVADLRRFVESKVILEDVFGLEALENPSDQYPDPGSGS